MTLALTTTTYDTRTGEILDSDVELYASNGMGQGFNFTCSTTAPDYDVQAVVGHEAGHVLGLDHPCEDGTPQPVPGYPVCDGGVQPAIMWPTTGSVSQRELQQDDMDGVCTMYPVGQATLTCPPIADDSGGGCSSGGGAGIAALGAAAALAALRLPRRR
jgi:hypothetical protein